MNFLIFIISAIVLYPILGTVLGTLLTLYNFYNLRLKIVILKILRSLSYTIILWLISPSTFNNSIIWLVCFYFAVLVRDTIFNSERFLSSLEKKTDDNFSIKYIDSLLQTNQLEIVLDDNKHLDLSEMKSLFNYPSSLTFTDNDNKTRFIILNRQTWTQASGSLNAANTALAIWRRYE